MKIRVPVAHDGSLFTSHLARRNGFWVGDKGTEKHFATFFEALDALHRMPIPRWRRPNKNGNWGTVRGVDWIDIDDEFDN